MEAKIDMLNELWLMITTDILFLFTEHTPIEARFKYGYVYIALFAFAWVSNIVYQIITRITTYYRLKSIKKAQASEPLVEESPKSVEENNPSPILPEQAPPAFIGMEPISHVSGLPQVHPPDVPVYTHVWNEVFGY